MKKLFAIGLLLCTVLLSACTGGTKAVVEPEVIIDESSIFMQQCTADTPLPTKIVVDKDGNRGYDGNEVMKVLTSWQLTYDDCSMKHDKLIKLIHDLQNGRVMIIKKSTKVQ